MNLEIMYQIKLKIMSDSEYTYLKIYTLVCLKEEILFFLYLNLSDFEIVFKCGYEKSCAKSSLG